MTTHIVEELTPYPIDNKRLRLPFVINHTCPKCKGPIDADFDMQPLMYPTVNEPYTVGLYCNECHSEYQIDVTLKIQLEVKDNLKEIKR